MFKLPTLQGIIKRRILVNYRADPVAVKRLLPAGFRPKTFQGHAIAGICLIRLEHIRPKFAPDLLGLSSENAAHRIAVVWEEGSEMREGVYIPRRDTDSAINSSAGGRIFPGEQNLANFNVEESDGRIDLAMRSRDGKVMIELGGRESREMPEGSLFASLDEASRFFETGSQGYSVTAGQRHLDGVELKVNKWRVEPLELDHVYSSFYSDRAIFPAGSIEFDHALIMRDVEHEWHSLPDIEVKYV
jgi:hypothetical protein